MPEKTENSKLKESIKSVLQQTIDAAVRSNPVTNVVKMATTPSNQYTTRAVPDYELSNYPPEDLQYAQETSGPVIPLGKQREAKKWYNVPVRQSTLEAGAEDVANLAAIGMLGYSAVAPVMQSPQVQSRLANFAFQPRTQYIGPTQNDPKSFVETTAPKPGFEWLGKWLVPEHPAFKPPMTRAEKIAGVQAYYAGKGQEMSPSGEPMTLSDLSGSKLAQAVTSTSQPTIVKPSVPGVIEQPILQPMAGGKFHGPTPLKPGEKLGSMTGITRITTPTPVRTTSGEKVTLPVGEEYRTYEIADAEGKPKDKVILQDGGRHVVQKSELEKVQKNNLTLGEFAPELKQTEEVVKGIPENFTFSDWLNSKAINPNDYTQRELNELSRQFQNEKGLTKFSQYTLPGGENYKEIIIKAPQEKIIPEITEIKPLPQGGFRVMWNNGFRLNALQAKTPKEARLYAREQLDFGMVPTNPNEYESSHWPGIKNPISHLRMNQRTTKQNESVSFIEEIQSDWARQHRQEIEQIAKEHDMDPKEVEKYIKESGLTSEEAAKGDQTLSPSHPLLKNWQELTLKRALQEAVANKSKYLSWTTGQQQADRYDLSKQVKEIVPINNGNGTYDLKITVKEGRDVIKKTVNAQELPNYVGKELAERIQKQGVGAAPVYEGEDLKIGGEWAKNLYDKQIPSILEKLTGEKVVKINLSGNELTPLKAAKLLKEGKKLYWQHHEGADGYVPIKSQADLKDLIDNQDVGQPQVFEQKFSVQRAITVPAKSNLTEKPKPAWFIKNEKGEPVDLVYDEDLAYDKAHQLNATEGTIGQDALPITPKVIAKVLGQPAAGGMIPSEIFPPTSPKLPPTAEGSVPAEPGQPEFPISKINLEKYDPETAKIMQELINKNPEIIKRKIITNEELKKMADTIDEFYVLKHIIGKGEGRLAAEMLKNREVQSAMIMSIAEQDLTKLQDSLLKIAQRQTGATGKASTEIARALQQQKITIDKQFEMAKVISDKLDQVKKAKDIDKMTKKLLTDGLIELRQKHLSKDFNPTWDDKIYEFWMNNILSGIFTHMRNIIGNTTFGVLKPIEKTSAAAIDSIIGKFTGKREHYFSEIPANLKGIIDLLKNKQYTLPHGDVTKFELQKPGAIKGLKGKIIRTPGTLLNVEDLIAKRLTGFAEMNARAEAIAKQEGLTGQAFVDRKNQLLLNPTDKLTSEVDREQLYRTFQDRTGLSQIVMKLPRKWARWIIPFVRTPSSIITKALERTPAGLGMAGGRAIGGKTGLGSKYGQYEFSRDVGNALIGTTLMAWLVYLYAKDKVTGPAPKKDFERQKFYKEGKQPYAIKVGDVWVPYSQIEPYGTATMMMVNFIESVDKSKEGTTPEKLIDAGLTSAKFFSDKTFLQGMTNAVKAANEPDVYGEQFLTNIMGGFVPGSSLLSNFQRMNDLTVRQPDNMLERIGARIPGVSQNIRPRLSSFGEEIQREPLGITRYMPYQLTKAKEAPLEEFLLGIDKPYNKISKTWHGFELTPDQMDEVTRASGTEVKKKLEIVMKDPEFAKLDERTQRQVVERIYNQAREQYAKPLLSDVAVSQFLKDTKGMDNKRKAEYIKEFGKKYNLSAQTWNELLQIHNQKKQFLNKTYTGQASTFGWGEKLNNVTYNGEPFSTKVSANKVGVAMQGVPMGTIVEITAPDTGKTIQAEVIDGGPNKRLNRVVDLTQKAWKELGYNKQGISKKDVTVKIIKVGNGRIFIQK